ncbi:MAG: hypothetical protein KAU50_10035, partial [Candidatus Marinimicrobia bacterium]|nr:hypothetical protein [Candidatus Neomarinimicrobiota bacterium]
YIANSTIRFMPIISAHGPQAAHIHVMKGEVKPGLKRAPKSAWRWKEGKTLAFLIDFLDGANEVDYRIYYQDATTPDTLGFPPVLPEAEQHVIDLAVVCVGSAQVLDEYPTLFMERYQPRHVMLAHWENFFRSPVKPTNRLRMTHIDRFIDEVRAASPATGHTLPKPGAWYRYYAANKNGVTDQPITP